jgi:predicted nuclease of predicted toxin-antitoxin system
MAEAELSVLLDQNVPVAAAEWLRRERPNWRVEHTNELGFAGKSDEFLYGWAQNHKSIIVTFDEHFADARFRRLGPHHGVVRLRVWPTTIEATIDGLRRLIENVNENDLRGSLIIVDAAKIRLRKP